MTKEKQIPQKFHPGEYLKEELKSRNMKLSYFSIESKLPVLLLSEIIEGKASISQGIARRLEKALGISAQMWLNLQRAWDEHEKEET